MKFWAINILIFACASAADGAEPIFSLDAAHSQKSPGHGRGVAAWDQARQISAGARPTYHLGDGEGFLRFDGKDDFLFVQGPKRSTPEMTVFILAAPMANPGFFSGLFACAPNGQNDYTDGLNVDFGPGPTTNLSVVNIESTGSGGFNDLLKPGFVQTGVYPFGGFHVFTVRSKAGPKGTELFVDGILTGDRPRSPSQIGFSDMVIGGRLYSNDPSQLPFAQGFFQGDLAAISIYDTALADADREKIEQALFARVAKLNALSSGRHGHSLETVANPPPIQMLAPGFTAHELPIKLSNINNVRYRPDGKLLAVAYDGKLHLLADSDNDGLEDRSQIFWDKTPLRAPLGVALLPKDDPRGDGVFVASKGKISLILDKDRDGRADEEIVVASGWKEIPHGVDTLGLALDPKDGSIYFTISVENFVDAYLRDANGKSHYSLTSERGTVQRVSRDFSQRETIATGVRFICALAFNREGDLFATDQEGATWLPNGNPLDELLHIQKGKHYGFPPRHPKHLPNVIDEPPIMEYGPQHQSTVGMIFDEGVNGGPAFGPANWHGDAIICGESRGKIYRTKLVKTDAGYVADNHLIACNSMLTVDSCVTPQGDLVVACHSGPPDWGTGPAGEGRLFKVRYARKDVPQIARAWAAGPDEFRIGFDRPLKAGDWAGAREKIRVEAGRHVQAGDRFETIRPGYQVVRDQMAAPRCWVDVQALSISADGRTMILHVPRQTEDVNYAITLPTPDAWQAKGGIDQHPQIDLALNLKGVVANNKIVLPHPDLRVAKAFTMGSAEHEAFLAETKHAETKATINDANIFVPATQPGSSLDWDISKDAFANKRMKVREDYTFELDGERRAIRAEKFSLPWATASGEKQPEMAARTDMKGNWMRGRKLFFAEATCGTCHTVRGEGVLFGPDLSNLLFRDRESVLKDIAFPSATINPDHAGSLIKFKDGEELNGWVRTLNDKKVVIRLPGGVENEHARADVIAIEPLKNSLMPEGLAAALSKDQMEDLLTFLLTNPLEPTRISRLDPPIPPARTRAEIEPFLSATKPASLKPLRLLLCAGPKDHGVDEHDYPLWLDRWSKLLSFAQGVTIVTNSGFPTREQFAGADVTIFYSNNPGWNEDAAKELDAYQKRGGGLVYIHWAVEGHEHPLPLAERIGLAFSMSAFRHGDMDLVFNDPAHPITQGFSRLKLVDETYWKMHGDAKRLHNLADNMEDGQPWPQIWTYERENSRVFVSIPGHYMWTFDDPLFRILLLRGIAWTAKEENVNRFNELATIGSRVAP